MRCAAAAELGIDRIGTAEAKQGEAGAWQGQELSRKELQRLSMAKKRKGMAMDGTARLRLGLERQRLGAELMRVDLRGHG